MIESINAEEERDYITSAGRIESKRRQKRRESLVKLKNGLLVILFIMSLGLTSYAVTETGTPKESKSNEADAAIVIDKAEPIYDCFATVGKSSLRLSLPGKKGDVVGVGFHEAERREAIAITPSVDYLNKETTATVRGAIERSKVPVLFVMNSRGRGSAPTSAIDIAMVPNAEVYSPVDGVVTTVKTYSLYSKVTDFHVEIQPDGYEDLRIAIIHIDGVQLEVGQRVKRRETRMGSIRSLPQIKSQIHRYLPEPSDHVHIQVNPATVNVDLGS